MNPRLVLGRIKHTVKSVEKEYDKCIPENCKLTQQSLCLGHRHTGNQEANFYSSHQHLAGFGESGENQA